MKARLLTKLLNTGYIVGDYGSYIGIGSPLCHRLLNMDKKTFKINYALDWQNKGKRGVDSEEILRTWNALEMLVEQGKIQDILDGEDIIENPITLYYIEGFEVKETCTDVVGWPHTTKEGWVQSNNDYYTDKLEAIRQQIKYRKQSATLCEENIAIKKEELGKSQTRYDTLCHEVYELQLQLNDLEK